MRLIDYIVSYISVIAAVVISGFLILVFMAVASRFPMFQDGFWSQAKVDAIIMGVVAILAVAFAILIDYAGHLIESEE